MNCGFAGRAALEVLFSFSPVRAARPPVPQSRRRMPQAGHPKACAGCAGY
nr:MAG TPA: hypothetical protein [Caudoviricetes sp.]